MTVVVARIFEDRLLMAADTMTTDRDAPRPNAVPGVLKIVSLSERLSVGYAGDVGRAIVALRKAHALVLANEGLLAVVDCLIHYSKEERGGDSVDFLVGAHVPEPTIIRVRDGRSSQRLESAHVGCGDILDRLTNKRLEQTEKFDWISGEQIEFGWRFDGIFSNEGVQLTPEVGGIPIHLDGSPHGHYYPSRAFSMSWDPIQFGIQETPEQQSARDARARSGMSEWKYHIYSSQWRGVPVVGIFLEHIQRGWIHNPLVSWRPTSALYSDQSTFHDAVQNVSKEFIDQFRISPSM